MYQRLRITHNTRRSSWPKAVLEEKTERVLEGQAGAEAAMLTVVDAARAALVMARVVGVAVGRGAKAKHMGP